MNSEQSIIFFWLPNDTWGNFSNWSRHEITENQVTFLTTEHYFMYHKAKLMNDIMTAEQILHFAKTPKEAKEFGRLVKNWNEDLWNEKKEGIMLNGLRLKIEQHPSIKQELVATDCSILAEASPYDRIWGIGVRAGTPQNEWRGQNLLGKGWMKLRDEVNQSGLANPVLLSSQ